MQIDNRRISKMGRAWCWLRVLMVATLGVLTLTQRAAEAAQAVRQVEGVSEYRLSNGLRVLLAPDPGAQRTFVNIVYHVGSLQEGYGESGMAHLLEHLVFRRTEGTPSPMKEMQRRGMVWNGTTSYDRTNYFASFLPDPESLNWYLGWLADSMTKAVVTREELDGEMTVVRNEFEIGENRGAAVAWQRMRRAAFQWHGYGRAVIGARSDIEQVPIEKLQAFYRHWYRPDNASLVLSGRFEVDAALARIEQTFGAIAQPKTPLQRNYTQEPAQDGERQVTVRRPGGAASVSMSWHSVPAIHQDDAALDVLAVILAGGPTSRLFKNLVEPGLAVAVYANQSGNREAGTFDLSAVAHDESKLEEIRKVVEKALAQVIAEGVQPQELALAQQRLLNGAMASLRTAESLGRSLAEALALGDWRYPFWSRDQLKSVTAEQVQAVATRWLLDDNRTLGWYLPTANPQRAPTLEVNDNARSPIADYQGGPQAQSSQNFTTEPLEIERHIVRSQLPGGLKLALLPKPSRGDRVRGMLRLNWGTLASVQATPWIAQTGELLTMGTQRYSREALSAKLAELDATLISQGSAGGATLTFETSAANWPALLELVAEVAQNPTFPTQEVLNWQRAVMTQLKAAADEPSTLLSQAVYGAVNPYGLNDPRHVNTTAESIAKLEKITPEGLREAYRRFAGAQNAEFAAVGQFDADTTRAWLVKTLDGWRSTEPFQRIEREALAYAPQSLKIQTPGKANAVFQQAAVWSYDRDRTQGLAAELAMSAFAGGPGSRLHIRVREQEGLSYSVRGGAGLSMDDGVGALNLSATFAPQNRERLERVMATEWQKFMAQGVTSAEFETTRQRLLKSERMALSEDGALLGRLAADLPFGRNMAWTDERIKTMEQLTLDQVNEAVKRYYTQLSWVQGVAGAWE